MPSPFCFVWIALAPLALLGGCSSGFEKGSQADHEAVQSRVRAASEQLRVEPGKPERLVMDTVPRFTRMSVAFQPTQMLPAHIGTVTLRLPGKHNLRTVASLIERLTLLPVSVSPDALLPASDFAPGAAANPQAAGGTGQAAREEPEAASSSKAAALALQKAGGPQQWEAPAEAAPEFELNYRGPLAGLLDQLASRADLQWMYSGGRIYFYRMVTRNVNVKTLSGSGSASPAEVDIWSGIRQTLAGMVSRHAKLQIDPGMGSVTVRDVLSNVQAIERHIESLNRQLSRQVSLTVEVLQVALNNEHQAGIDWNYVVNSTTLGLGTFTGPPAVTSNTGSIGFVKANSGGSNNILMLRALEKFGRVSSSYSSVVNTMNRQAVPLGSTNTQSYLKQVTPSVTTTATGQIVYGPPGLTPGEITTGFTMSMMPIVLDSNQVLMQLSIQISSLKGLTTFASGTGGAQQSVQQPQVANFTTQQRMAVRSGDTIVLSGFENESTASEQSDLVRNALPGTRTNTREKSTLVVLVTPRLLEF